MGRNLNMLEVLDGMMCVLDKIQLVFEVMIYEPHCEETTMGDFINNQIKASKVFDSYVQTGKASEIVYDYIVILQNQIKNTYEAVTTERSLKQYER